MAAKHLNPKKAEDKLEEHAVQMFLGEMVLSKANVIRYNSMSSRSCGAVGTLFVTNFKIAFTCSGSYSNDSENSASVASLDKLLSDERSDFDDFIPLTAVHEIYAISSTKHKRKKVKSAKKEISYHYDIIEIETKDLRVIQYKFATKQDRRPSFLMASHYSFPTNVSRLFAFDYGQNVCKLNSNRTGRAFFNFHHKKDYEMNLSRLKSSENWRVSSINSKFVICKSLPEFIVCPALLEDKDLGQIAERYCDNRFPVWLWSDPNTGVALLLSSDLRDKDEASQSQPPKILLESITQCQTTRPGETIAFDLCSACPSLYQLKQSFRKLRKLCVIRTSKEFWISDSNWLGQVQETGWVQHVAVCLEISKEIVAYIKERNTSIIVHHEDGRNMSILITSLVQILLDPYYRTNLGLQALIQKDWVMKGYPFSKRLGIIFTPKKKDVKESSYDGDSPLLLLFLDCVHQLLRQYPQKFEYTQQFLILLVDCSYSSLFETYLFDCDYDCQSKTGKSQLVSAWDFLATNIPQAKFSSVFTNPVFKLEEVDQQICSDYHRSVASSNSYDICAGVDVIIPVTLMTHLQVWYNFLFRWFPYTELDKGWSTEVVLHLQQKEFMDEVVYLQDRMLQLQHASATVSHARSPSNLSTDSNPSTLGRRKKHKRNISRFSNNDEIRNDYLTLLSGFYFLKML